MDTILPPSWSRLTGRERQVLSLLAEGLSNKRIARHLELSPYTVKRHVANVLGKLDVVSRGQAAAVWYRAHVSMPQILTARGRLLPARRGAPTTQQITALTE